MAGMDIDVDELRIAAEDLLPAVAGFFDNLATDLGGIGTSAISGLLPEDTTGGNALGEAVVESLSGARRPPQPGSKKYADASISCSRDPRPHSRPSPTSSTRTSA